MYIKRGRGGSFHIVPPLFWLYSTISLKIPSGQIGSAWEWYHWIGLEKDINHYIFEKTSKFWATSCKKASNPPDCSVRGLHVLKPQSFLPNRACSKNAGEISIVLWISARKWRIPSFRNRNQNRATLWRIFSSNESAPANRGRQDSLQTVIQTRRRLDSFLHEAALNFELLSNTQNLKHIAVDVILKGYPKVPLSCRSNMGRRYL